MKKKYLGICLGVWGGVAAVSSLLPGTKAQARPTLLSVLVKHGLGNGNGFITRNVFGGSSIKTIVGNGSGNNTSALNLRPGSKYTLINGNGDNIPINVTGNGPKTIMLPAGGQLKIDTTTNDGSPKVMLIKPNGDGSVDASTYKTTVGGGSKFKFYEVTGSGNGSKLTKTVRTTDPTENSTTTLVVTMALGDSNSLTARSVTRNPEGTTTKYHGGDKTVIIYENN